MNGHLLRCRFGIPPHVRLSTLRGDPSLDRVTFFCFWGMPFGPGCRQD